jgi:hypothetical protein
MAVAGGGLIAAVEAGGDKGDEGFSGKASGGRFGTSGRLPCAAFLLRFGRLVVKLKSIQISLDAGV